jgi:hypothetical protein
MKINEKIKIYYYCEKTGLEEFCKTLKEDVKDIFLCELKVFTGNYKSSLTIENLIDIQGEVEKIIRKKYVLSGKLLDFTISGFDFAKNLKSVRIVIMCYSPSWYARDNKIDQLEQDLLDIDINIKLPKILKITPDIFDLDISECEQCREKECTWYADYYDVKRTDRIKKLNYENNLSYFASISRR